MSCCTQLPTSLLHRLRLAQSCLQQQQQQKQKQEPVSVTAACVCLWTHTERRWRVEEAHKSRVGSRRRWSGRQAKSLRHTRCTQRVLTVHAGATVSRSLPSFSFACRTACLYCLSQRAMAPTPPSSNVFFLHSLTKQATLMLVFVCVRALFQERTRDRQSVRHSETQVMPAKRAAASRYPHPILSLAPFHEPRSPSLQTVSTQSLCLTLDDSQCLCNFPFAAPLFNI